MWVLVRDCRYVEDGPVREMAGIEGPRVWVVMFVLGVAREE